MNDLSSERRSYTLGGLAESQAPASPLELFDRWYAEAAEVCEPNAMVLATADEDGLPEARTVLLKSYAEEGFAFFTQLDSPKGRALAANPRCALLFPWLELQRQVRVCGTTSLIGRDAVDSYFSSRPRESQLGAWATIEAGGQTSVVRDRATLDTTYAALAERWADQPVPTPPTWGGYLVAPTSVEFWQGRVGRLHDRLRYRLVNGAWVRERLAP